MGQFWFVEEGGMGRGVGRSYQYIWMNIGEGGQTFVRQNINFKNGSSKCKQMGYQNRKSAKKNWGGPKFCLFCDNLINAPNRNIIFTMKTESMKRE